MRTSSITLGVLVLAASQLGASECGGGVVLRDPGFELWCGETLCAWNTDRGAIRRAPTWHASDSGIEFVGDDVAISQLSGITDRACIQFDLVANVADTAEMFLEIDLRGDGTVERSERIPTSSWQPLSYLLQLTGPFEAVRFSLVKRGPGTAVLAQIEAERLASTECDGLTPIKPIPPPGAAAGGSGAEPCSDGAPAANCPVASGRTPGPCTTVGVQGGSCE